MIDWCIYGYIFRYFGGTIDKYAWILQTIRQILIGMNRQIDLSIDPWTESWTDVLWASGRKLMQISYIVTVTVIALSDLRYFLPNSIYLQFSYVRTSACFITTTWPELLGFVWPITCAGCVELELCSAVSPDLYPCLLPNRDEGVHFFLSLLFVTIFTLLYPGFASCSDWIGFVLRVIKLARNRRTAVIPANALLFIPRWQLHIQISLGLNEITSDARQLGTQIVLSNACRWCRMQKQSHLCTSKFIYTGCT